MIFDTHAHYNFPAFDDLCFDDLRATVSHVVVPSTQPENLQEVLALCARVDFFHAALGFHPHSAGDFDPSWRDLLQDLLQAHRKRVFAVGECGLDVFGEHAPLSRQCALFEMQLELCAMFDLPVIVHDRDAHADTFAILREHKVRGVLHCFSGDADFAERILDLGFYVSFTGNVTYKKNDFLREAARVVPPDRLLVETDAPYLAPLAHRGKRCDSRMIALTLDCLADTRGCDRAALEAQTEENAKILFGVG